MLLTRTCSCSKRRRSLRKSLVKDLAAFAALVLLAAPARSQTNCAPPSGALPSVPAGCSGFYKCFLQSGLSQYGIPLRGNNGASFQGDLNSAYSNLFYSINNANSVYSGGSNCFELILVGTFPQIRYFSITANDMHYSNAQHLSDAAIDPVGNTTTSYKNPFTPGKAYSANQWYLVPISLGAVPNGTGTCGPQCQIDPFEEDNLLDATQRHFSMDWNTVVPGNETVAPPTTPHVVDNYTHAYPNLAGDIVIRNYLSLPPTNCTLSQPANCVPQSVTPPYLVVRDTASGLPYNASYLQTANLVYAPAAGTQPLDCSTSNPTPSPYCNAIASTVDLSICPASNPSCTVLNWLSTAQQAAHVSYTQVTAQACYKDGSSTNKVAWTRGPEWVGRPGPEDAYIGGVISSNDLVGLGNNVIKLQFKIPKMPTIPSSGSLSGSEDMRYWSMSFLQAGQGTPTVPLFQNPDGIYTPSATPSSTLISISDAAFCTTTPCTVTLLVTTGTQSVPSTITSGKTQVINGVYPILNRTQSDYALYQATGQASGYFILDLSQFTGTGCTTSSPCFSTGQDLQILIRNTLPNTSSSFISCSGQNVPYYTAEYTGNGDLMGPYAPVVGYPAASSLQVPPVVNLPSSCATLPTGSNAFPGLNIAGLQTGNHVTWPTYWPSSTAVPNPLTCSTGAPPYTNTSITFMKTPINVEVNPNCTSTCTHITAWQSQPVVLTPPQQITIVGTGFGYLPETLPYAVQSSQYIEIKDVANGTTKWDTGTGATGASCQIYVADWTDTSITLLANLPINAYNLYLNPQPPPTIFLSALADVSPLTFFFPSSYNTQACSITAAQDQLTITVKNPQNGSQYSQSATVQSQ